MRRELTIDDTIYEMKLRVNKLIEEMEKLSFKEQPVEYMSYQMRITELISMIDWIETRAKIGL